MESGSWLVALPAVDGKQYVYRVYAPEDARPADLFWQAWHCHDESPYPRAWDLSTPRRYGRSAEPASSSRSDIF
ncbi:hypothetical protein ACFY94_29835 [Streptomyces griseorubiginosus]|uniref:hypothetical protein n=1 Tax=Streptomyces griseorubiginosus TaxID=67304 RepID=UPI0036EC0816